MSDDPILLYLHGVRENDQEDDWKAPLAKSLAQLGYPDLDSAHVIAPKYFNALYNWDEKQSLPPVTGRPFSRDEAKQNRRDYERRTAAVEFRLGRHDGGTGRLGNDEVVSALAGALPFKQARNYVSNPQIRAQVLNRILSKVPKTGRIVVIGYSLGSVIAADLLPRLPSGVEVAGMITIGSPLSNGSFNVDRLRDELKQPPANLSWWVNFWNMRDPVAAHRGIASVFPWLVDFRIDTKKTLVSAHKGAEYLSNETVAAAVGFALFGSQSTELEGINRGVNLPLDSAEQYALLALRYAHLVVKKLEGDQKDRYAGALRQVQSTVVEDIRRRSSAEKRAMPSSIARLAFDFSSPQAALPEPAPADSITKETAVVALSVLASENVIRPFEISLPKGVAEDAMRDLSAELGLSSKFGADVFAAARNAREALSGPRAVNWLKVGALGAAAAAVVVATGGVALAVGAGAGAGLAGAAVITSGLASFGPGGMVGGLVTAGALVTVTSGGLAYGLAGAGTTAETLEAIVERRLATVILRQLQGMEPDESVWRILVDIETSVRRQYERLDEFSDPASIALKELKHKIDTVERALKYLKDHDLEPTIMSDQSDDED